ncbi:MAG: RluB protein [Lachnospiraceae bacterium]|nr:RluB protein [Lachnospiraceae bacterium]
MIDNADIMLDDALRWYIATDVKNQYILIGRNPTGLMLDQEEIMELESRTEDGKTVFTLKHSF